MSEPSHNKKIDLLCKLLINVNQKIIRSVNNDHEDKLSELIKERSELIKELTKYKKKINELHIKAISSSFNTLIKNIQEKTKATKNEIIKVKKAKQLAQKYQLGRNID